MRSRTPTRELRSGWPCTLLPRPLVHAPAPSGDLRADLRSGSSVGSRRSAGSLSGISDQFCSPSTGVKSCRLLQQLLKICRPLESNWSAERGGEAVTDRRDGRRAGEGVLLLQTEEPCGRYK